MANEVEEVNTELRFVPINLYEVVLQTGEDLVKVLSVRGFNRARDE